MIIWGTVMEGNPFNPAHANDGTVLKNRVDTRLDPIPEDHVGTEIVPALGNCVDEVILILKNHVDKGIVHIRTGMLTEVRTLLRIKCLTTLPWMP